MGIFLIPSALDGPWRPAQNPSFAEDARSDFNSRSSKRTNIPSKPVPLILDNSSSACSGVRAAAIVCSVSMLA